MCSIYSCPFVFLSSNPLFHQSRPKPRVSLTPVFFSFSPLKFLFRSSCQLYLPSPFPTSIHQYSGPFPKMTFYLEYRAFFLSMAHLRTKKSFSPFLPPLPPQSAHTSFYFSLSPHHPVISGHNGNYVDMKV